MKAAAGAKTPAPKRTRGRPATRQREAFMLAIWRAVQEEIHTRGAPSVREACRRIFYNRAGTVIKFVAEDGEVLDVINGISGAETLRQRYCEAERCRKDGDRYPMLHARAKQLEAILPGTFERVQAAQEKARRERASGIDPLA
jgi:hypothetical protein